ncbi:hypothetical protein D3C79_1012410 [compost metagenome]
MAPTGSSTFNFHSMKRTPSTSNGAAIMPIMIEPIILTFAAPAVMPTRPAKAPFNVREPSI